MHLHLQGSISAMLYSQTLYLVVIEEALIVYTIGYNVEVKAGKFTGLP